MTATSLAGRTLQRAKSTGKIAMTLVQPTRESKAPATLSTGWAMAMTGLKLPVSCTGLPTGLPTVLPTELHPAAAGSRRGSRGARESPTNRFSKSSSMVTLLCMAASADRERNLRGLGHGRRASGIRYSLDSEDSMSLSPIVHQN